GESGERAARFFGRGSRGLAVRAEELMRDNCRAGRKAVQVQGARPQRMDDLPGQVPETAVAVGVEGKGFAKFQPAKPPLHPNAFGTRADQDIQFANTLLYDVRGRRADGKL